MSSLPDAARLKSSPDTAVLFAASERWRCPICAVKRLGCWTWRRPPGPQRRAVRYSVEDTHPGRSGSGWVSREKAKGPPRRTFVEFLLLSSEYQAGWGSRFIFWELEAG